MVRSRHARGGYVRRFHPRARHAEARRFYEGALGLRVVEDTPYALVVEANGTMLRITPVPELTV
jgi:catechol 2,3-dioxygenase-like lactoylglutathione lyase family enzyme